MSISHITTESGKENWDLFCKNLTLPEGGKILIGDREIDSIGSWQPAVIGFLPAPPIGPSEGDRYIISAVATGIWTGREDDIAEWSGVAWVYTTPEDGYTTVNQTDNLVYIYDTMWNPIGVSSSLQSSYDISTSPQIVTSDLRGELTLRRGTTSDTDNVLKVENGAGDEKFSVLGDGTLKVEKLTELNSSGSGILVEVNDARPFTVQGTGNNNNDFFEVQDNGGTPTFSVAGTGKVTARNIILGPITAEISSSTDDNQLDIYGGVSGSGPHIRLYGPTSGSNANRLRLEGDRIDFRSLSGTRLFFLDMVNQNVDSSIPIEGTSILGRVPANGLNVEDINFTGRVMSTSESTGIRIQSNSVTGTDTILACRDSTESNVLTVNNDGVLKVNSITELTGSGVSIDNILIDNNNIEGVNSIESNTGPGGTVDFNGDINLLDLDPEYKVNGATVLTGTTLGSGVLNSSLTSVGTLTSLDLGGDVTMNSNNISGIGSLTLDNLYLDGNTIQATTGDINFECGGVHVHSFNVGGTPKMIIGSSSINFTGTGAVNFSADEVNVDDINLNGNKITASTANLDLVAPNGDIYNEARVRTTVDLRFASHQAIDAQGGYLQWNRDSTGRMFIVNQRGIGSGGISFGKSDTSNNYTEFGAFDSNGNLTIKGRILGVEDSLAFEARRETASTNNVNAVGQFELKSTGTMVDGFGPSIEFDVGDTGGSNVIGDIACVRNGADNSGQMKLRLKEAGSTYDTLTLATVSSTGSKLTLNNPAGTKDINMTVNTASDLAVLSTSCDMWSISDKVEMPGLSTGLSGNNVGITSGGELFEITSSKRFKENIVSSKYGLDSVMKMNPVEYNYVDKDSGKFIGLIAEELLDIVPEAITFEKDGKTPRGIDYLELVPVCIKAIQEMNLDRSSGSSKVSTSTGRMLRRIVQLEKENSMLVKKMNTLELQVQDLMKRL